MSALPPPRFVAANGIRMAVYEQGKGLPVVLCHGFPELAYSWRHQLPALAAAGFRAIAPDQRGYGLTDRPAAVEAYDMAHLTGDLVGLLDALEIEKAVFCGHDWGGLITWQMPLRHPDRVAGVIGLCTPFIPRLSADPIALMRAAYGDDMYIVAFQQPEVADRALAADVGRSVDFFLRRGGAPDPQGERQELLKALAAGNWPGETFLSLKERAFYVESFSRTGFTGGINWYRNFTRNWTASAGLRQWIDVPSLMISAADDPFLPPSMAAGMAKYVGDLERHVIPACGHWIQQEQPAQTNRLMLDWLRRRVADLGPGDLGRL
ncbi:alpha/beta hydrolase [Oleomonas cavernae]|uniref:Alpha/beta hydrolase n=1 Tax=Oleomonas cavernae TaxID=2320859 RepID=A0A418WC29_9PROT|nr:alpha/beta hydrolase [Oleomonas cavernae]RJF87534.1 alpha/beta hydrolase [Oleomonas cavernae]